MLIPMGKRSRLKIIYDILNEIRRNENSIKPTPLLRYSNLSFQSFSKYFDELIEKELIEEKEKTVIKLTDKGHEYLKKYKKITNFIDEFDL